MNESSCTYKLEKFILNEKKKNSNDECVLMKCIGIKYVGMKK